MGPRGLWTACVHRKGRSRRWRRCYRAAAWRPQLPRQGQKQSASRRPDGTFNKTGRARGPGRRRLEGGRLRWQGHPGGGLVGAGGGKARAAVGHPEQVVRAWNRERPPGLRGRCVPGRRAWPLGHPGPQAAPDAGDRQPRTDAERGVQGGRGRKRAGKGGEGLGAGGGRPLRGPCPLWKILLLNTSWKQQKRGRSSRDVPRRRSGGPSLEAARPTSFGLERAKQRLRGQLRSAPAETKVTEV